MTPDQQKGLQVQNDGRKGKNLKPLEWDQKLCQEAQKWADHLAKDVGHMEHSKGDQRPNQGENLFWGWAQPGPYKDPYANAAHSWMNEASKYHGEKIGEGNFADFGHYSESSSSPVSEFDPPSTDMISPLSSPVHVAQHYQGRHGLCHRQERRSLCRRPLLSPWQLVS